MISRWIIKAFVQKTISYLPGSSKLNLFFQKHVTGGVYLTDEHFSMKLGHAKEHYEAFRTLSVPQSERTILELGTGWYPVVPLLFYLTASGEVISVDIQSWMSVGTQLTAIRKMKEWKERGLMEDLLPFIIPERWERLMEVVDTPSLQDMALINRTIGLTPLVHDARNLDIEKGTVDFICSNNTFEHIPAPLLKEILLEFKRVIRPGGVMSHFIDMSDHFAHFDPRITIYNFLKFSRKRWEILDNRIQPQNRLRFRDYLEIFRELGVPVSETDVRAGEPEKLGSVRIHREFSGYTREELAISHATIISRFP